MSFCGPCGESGLAFWGRSVILAPLFPPWSCTSSRGVREAVLNASANDVSRTIRNRMHSGRCLALPGDRLRLWRFRRTGRNAEGSACSNRLAIRKPFSSSTRRLTPSRTTPTATTIWRPSITGWARSTIRRRISTGRTLLSDVPRPQSRPYRVLPGLAVLMVQQGRPDAAFRLIEDWAASARRRPSRDRVARLHQESATRRPPRNACWKPGRRSRQRPGATALGSLASSG